MQNNFKIYDASAGSGKTFNLASSYIAAAILDGFMGILAVTFTNAAAKEMKDRIIDVLHQIASDSEDNQTIAYKKNIIKLLEEKTRIRITDSQIKDSANDVLKQILHNYSFFNVLTIDSFFQVVLKNLTKELGVTGNYLLALGSAKYDEQAVKQLLNSENYQEEERKKVFKWLENFFIKKSDDGKSWNIEKELVNFTANALKNPILSQIINTGKGDILSIKHLQQTKNKIYESIKQFETDLAKKRQQFLDRCSELNLGAEDFKGKTRTGIYAVIDKNLLTKTSKKLLDGKEYPDSVAKEVNSITEFLNNNFDAYFLNKLCYNCIYQLGVINNIADIKSNLLKQDNVFVLSDTPMLLNKINEGDVPFVFEKTSQYVKNIFIDEFQDTNGASYENLDKIMYEALQSGGRSYIFGDIKQSIYRFNGGDYRLMYNLTENNPANIVDLTENYRSLGNIVRFNNEFFKPLYSACSIRFIDQKIVRQDNAGEVRLSFIDKDSDMFDYIKKEIDYFHLQLNYPLGDIAVLFRSNDKLVSVADRLKNETLLDYNPVSDIAFKFSSSFAVNKLIETLKYIDNNRRSISGELISNGEEQILKQIDELALSYKKEKSLLEVIMKAASLLKIDDDAVFLPAFYDTIKDYTRSRGGNLTEFLEYWQENLKDRSVDTSGVKSGVRLTSIHKSKGLAYKVVIIPYCDMSFSKSEDIWVRNRDKDSDLPVFSAPYTKLENTEYNDIYENEKHAQYLDNINLLYVAFTRCRDHLSVISHQPSASVLKAPPKAVNTLLYNYATKVKPHDFSEQKPNFFVYHNFKAEKTEQHCEYLQNDENIVVDKIRLYDNNIKFSTSNIEEFKDFFKDSYKEKTQREKGSLYHNLLSQIRDYEDKERIIQSFEQGDKEAETKKQLLEFVFSFSEKLHWFDNTYTVLNEKSILFKRQDGFITEKRPDRIMYNENEVIVVDYKFGKKDAKYKDQINEYINLLKNMTVFKDRIFKGFLWYFNTEDFSLSETEQV